MIEHAEAAADSAASHTLRLWAFWLVVEASVVATVVVRDVRFLGVAVLLVILYAIPYVVAGISTTWGEEERSDLTKSIHEHERRRAEEQAREQRGGQPGTA